MCIHLHRLRFSKENETFIRDFEKTFACCATNAILRKLDSDAFRSIAAVDYVLFNPDDSPDCARQMFLELPVESGEPFWTRVVHELQKTSTLALLPYVSGNK